MRRSTRVFDALLRLYPADFRDEYGREIVLVFGDRYRHAKGPLERAGVWLEATAGVIQEAPKEHIRMFSQDLRYAARALRANPLFSGMVVLALALGIGANSAIFSVVNAVVLRTLPVSHPEQLYVVKEEAGPNQQNRVSWPYFVRQREAAPGQLAAMNRGVAMLYARFGAGSQEPIAAQLVSGEFFGVLGVPAARGRVLGPEDNRAPGAHPVAVISYGCWQRRYGGSPDVVGQEMSLNGARFSIVGVAQEGFTGVWLESPTEVWLPVAMQHDVRYTQNYSASNAKTNEPWMPQDRIAWLMVIGRAPAGPGPLKAALDVQFQQGRAERAESLTDPQARRRFLQAKIGLDSFAHGNSRLRERFTEPLYLLMAMAGLVLLIACANAANLLLARATARQKEIALRLSLGAGRIRLFRQLLTESLLLVSVASVAALAIGRWTSDALVRMATSTLTGPAPFAAGVEWRVLAFTASVALATAVLFGVGPAARATRIDPAAALKSGGRSISGSSGRAPRALVVMQVALSLVLVVGAGLLVRSVRNALETTLGFEREHVLSVACDPRLAGYRAEQLPALYDRLRQQVGAVPGVRGVALAMCGILSGCRSASSGMSIEGYDRRPGENIVVVNNLVTPNYFDVVGMRLRAGRLLNERDRKGVVVVNEAFVRRYSGGRTLLGRKFGEDVLDLEIVGVVEDARVLDVKAGPEPMAYSPLTQVGVTPRSIEVRAEGDPGSIASAVRRTLAQAEPRLPIEKVTTLSERVETNLTQDRLLLSLFSTFGMLAVGLAGFGLFGLLSYAVARRREEFGVRMALGASPFAVLWTVVRESLLLAGIGVAVGAPLVIAAAEAMRSLLFGVSPRDGITILAAAGLLLAIAAIAGLLPAWRASRVDPLTALRSE